MTFENIVAKVEIAYAEQFLLWSPCFQIYGDFSGFFHYVFKVTCCGFVVCGKGLKSMQPRVEYIVNCYQLPFNTFRGFLMPLQQAFRKDIVAKR